MITLNLNPEVESNLRMIARQARTSADELVCRIVNEYVEKQTHTECSDTVIPPITKSLIGVIKSSTFKESDYQNYLWNKYL
ncbi:hypothetical protein CKO09_01895 [Chromatium weissei]|nr:hypothetical protein [Chromatium weissei]